LDMDASPVTVSIKTLSSSTFLRILISLSPIIPLTVPES
jgi:hypothetical protein